MIKYILKLIILLQIFVLVFLIFPQHALGYQNLKCKDRALVCDDSGCNYVDTCSNGCDACPASGQQNCCNGGTYPDCNGGMYDCTPGDGGGSTPPAPKPWTVSGQKVIYKGTGAFSAVRSENMLLRKTDDSGTANTTGDDLGAFSINKLIPSSGGSEIDILNGTYEAGISTPANWDVFSTFCKNGTDCHTLTSPRTGNPLSMVLGTEGGTASLNWHFVGPPTNLRALCNAAGTQAVLSWDRGGAASNWLVVDNLSSAAACTASPGPADFCGDVTSSSFTMNVTPNTPYGWWLNIETYQNAIAGSSFKCGPAPTATVRIPPPNCAGTPGKYAINEVISFESTPYSSTNIAGSKTYIAKEKTDRTGLISYGVGVTPTWCSSSGGTLQRANDGTGIFCTIADKVYPGNTTRPDPSFYTSNWTPSETGIYYAVVNARSVNPDVFQCSGNPTCEYSDSPIAASSGTPCASARFTSCQTGATTGKMGIPENYVPGNGSALWGESIRFEVVAAVACTPYPICGIVESYGGSTLSNQTVTVTSGGVSKEKITAASPFREKGMFSHLEFFPGDSYTVTLTSSPPAGEYLPVVLSYNDHVLGGALDCADGCYNQTRDVGCNFKYRSCIYAPISPITLETASIDFIPDFNLFEARSISWLQTAATAGTSFEVKLRTGGETITLNPAVVTPSPSGTNTRFTLSLDATRMKELHTNLLEANTDDIHIEITATRYAHADCVASGHSVSSELPETKIDTTENITIRVRKTAEVNSCTGGVVVDASADVSGNLQATTTADTSTPLVVAPPAIVANADRTITIPTGSSIAATYTFTSPYYDCNIGSACTTNPPSPPHNLSANPTKICKRTMRADAYGNVTLYISRLNIDSWWEASGGLVYGRVNIDSQLPLDGNVPILCPTDKKCLPWLVRSSTFTDNLLAGMPISQAISTNNGWLSERTQLPDKFNQSAKEGAALAGVNDSLKKTGGSAYTYFRNLVLSKVAITDLTSRNMTTTLDAASGYYQLGVDALTLTHTVVVPAATTLTVPADRSLVYFVNGNLTIGGASATPIAVTPGGFIAFIVSGKIDINSNVGTVIYTGALPSANNGVGLPTPPVANLTGIFIADGAITILSNNSSPDRRFIGAGSFISASGISMPRKYSYPSSYINSDFLAGYTPTELFRHRPDLVFNTPPFLKESTIQYQEIL